MTDLTYRQWMTQVDAALEKRTGLSMDQLPDWLSRDAYESGTSVAEAVDLCVKETGAADMLERLVDEA